MYNILRYEGEWKGGDQSGKGMMTYANGVKYDGQWKSNKQEGKGTSHFPNGDRYQLALFYHPIYNKSSDIIYEEYSPLLPFVYFNITDTDTRESGRTINKKDEEQCTLPTAISLWGIGLTISGKNEYPS